MEHTREPWVYHSGMIWKPERKDNQMSEDDIPIARMARETSGTIPTERDANARRIVACVNACKGHSTEMLKRGYIGVIIEEDNAVWFPPEEGGA